MTNTNYTVIACHDDLPKKDGFYYTIQEGREANNWFKDGKWVDEMLSGKPLWGISVL